MSKVVSLAARRTTHLGLWLGPVYMGAPVNRTTHDAWIESDGSLVLRFDPDAMRLNQKAGSFSGEDDVKVFSVRAGHEIRIPVDAMPEWLKDMQSFGTGSRRITEQRRGDHLWRCTPIGDGTYRVEHEQQAGIFEPFKPGWRKGRQLRPGVEVALRQEDMVPVRVAPTCSACQRVVQIGETMYRERRQTDRSGFYVWRTFGATQLCSTCITNAPNTGIADAGGEP